jgi:hypothetical protein
MNLADTARRLDPRRPEGQAAQTCRPDRVGRACRPRARTAGPVSANRGCPSDTHKRLRSRRPCAARTSGGTPSVVMECRLPGSGGMSLRSLFERSVSGGKEPHPHSQWLPAPTLKLQRVPCAPPRQTARLPPLARPTDQRHPAPPRLSPSPSRAASPCTCSMSCTTAASKAWMTAMSGRPSRCGRARPWSGSSSTRCAATRRSA